MRFAPENGKISLKPFDNSDKNGKKIGILMVKDQQPPLILSTGRNTSTDIPSMRLQTKIETRQQDGVFTGNRSRNLTATTLPTQSYQKPRNFEKKQALSNSSKKNNASLDTKVIGMINNKKIR